MVLERPNSIQRRKRHVIGLSSRSTSNVFMQSSLHQCRLHFSRSLLLLVVSNWSRYLVERLGSQGQRLGAGIWMGIGMAFAWVALID